MKQILKVDNPNVYAEYVDAPKLHQIRVTTYKGNVRTDKIQLKWKLVGTHTGRCTFIVNALSLGITPQHRDEMDRPLRLQGHEALHRYRGLHQGELDD